MSTYKEVLFEEIKGNGGNIGVMTLNRPDVLNALNHNMVNAMYARLKLWAVADDIKAVVIRAAEGRAFCAGGDLRLTYERIKAHDPSMSLFFHDEYQLNRFIFHFPKPYIAFLDGITMGGGVGISIHGSHRVATDRLLFAMPETGIGFFPDVGGTYFLPRLSGNMGYYLGLTGARIASDDCVALGIAQNKVPREQLPDLLDALAQHAFLDKARESVTQIIGRFNTSIKPTTLIEQHSVINTCFSLSSIEAFLQSLQQEENAFCKEAVNALTKKSPTSLKVTLRALRAAKHLDFDAAMRQEYRLACHFLEGHDFPEGIRAIIIDKDQSPKWDPPILEETSPDYVETYFAPVAQELV